MKQALLAIGMLVWLLGLCGCGDKADADALLVELTAAMNDHADAMSTINSVTDAAAAVHRLEEGNKRVKELLQKYQALSKAEEGRVQKKTLEEFRAAQKRWKQEQGRLTRLLEKTN
jgi:hypothetical protein